MTTGLAGAIRSSTGVSMVFFCPFPIGSRGQLIVRAHGGAAPASRGRVDRRLPVSPSVAAGVVVRGFVTPARLLLYVSRCLYSVNNTCAYSRLIAIFRAMGFVCTAI